MNHRYNNALNQRYNKVVKGNNAQWGMTDDKKLDSKGKGLFINSQRTKALQTELRREGKKR